MPISSKRRSVVSGVLPETASSVDNQIVQQGAGTLATSAGALSSAEPS